jgi:hypothetical protein
MWTLLAEPVFYIHPACPIAGPGADKRYRGLAEAFDCVGITATSEYVVDVVGDVVDEVGGVGGARNGDSRTCWDGI